MEKIGEIHSLNKLSFILGVPLEVLKTYASTKSKHYAPFIRKETKPNGAFKERNIDNPDKALRSIQKRINKRLLNPICKKLPQEMTGCIPGRSAKDNAKPHIGKQAVLGIDIKDCFPSINSSRVYKIFSQKLNYSPPVAAMLTKLCTFGNRLPQGAPTSPSLCNLVMKKLVIDLTIVAEKNHLAFTQYVDDLTFSGSIKNVRSAKLSIITAVQKYGFEVNQKKLKVALNFKRMETTGYVLNRRLSPGRKYFREIERDIISKKSSQSISGKIAHIKNTTKTKAKKLTKKFVK